MAILEQRTDIRLVVTGVETPGAVDGMKLATMVRDRRPPIEIVLLSAGAAPDLAALSARAEFMSKPVLSDRLLIKLRQLTRKGQEPPPPVHAHQRADRRAIGWLILSHR